MALQLSTGTIFQLKVTLDGISPPIWRRILVPGGCTIPQLHIVLQRSMGWQNYHLYAFERRRVWYVDPEGWDEKGARDRDATETTVRQMFTKVGQRLLYRYDMGDDWVHTILFEGLQTNKRGSSYPQCIDGKRRCSLEDCGGASGYKELLRVLSDPQDEGWEASNEWAGTNYNPERFDLAKVQERLHPRYRGAEDEWSAVREDSA